MDQKLNPERPAGAAKRGEDPGDLRAVLGVCLLLAGITLAVFGQTLRFGFVNYDDDVFVYNVPEVTHGLTAAGVAWAFEHGSFGFWDPLTTLSHMLDCELFGLDPGGHHLTNALLHMASVIVLFLVLRRMTGSLWPGAFVAALFAIHPLRVESVAWITERKDVLSGFFFMLALVAYARYVDGPPKLSRYLAVVACLILGLMSKAMLVTLPLVLLLLDYWPFNRLGRPVPAAADGEPSTRWRRLSVPGQVVLEKVPLLALSAAAGAITVLTQRRVHAVMSLEVAPLGARLANALVSPVVYLWQMLWPVNLAAYHPFPHDGTPWWSAGGAAAGLAVISWVAVIQRRSHPYLLVGWLWYLVVLLPVIGLLQAGGQAHADRYTYLPQIGVYMAVVWTMKGLCAGSPRRLAALVTAGIAVVAALGTCAHRQTAHWRDSESLWRHALACDPDNVLAHYNLGMAMSDLRRDDAAISEFASALKLQPDYPDAHNSLGFTLFRQGKVDEAIAQYDLVLKLHPDNALAHYNLGVALTQKGQTDDAIAHFEQAAAVQPDDAKIRNNLGMSYLQKRRLGDAMIQYQKALAIEPGSVLIRDNFAHLGWIFATSPDDSQRDGAKALTVTQQVLQSSGGNGPAYLAIEAAAHAERGDFPTAIATAERARERAAAADNFQLANAIQQQLAFYQVGRPFRDWSLANGGGKQ
jgi:protein O-mannosyl-transferase